VTGDAPGLPPSSIDSTTPSGAAPRIQPPDPTPVTFVQFVDEQYLYWSVVEVDARGVPGGRGVRCLVFTRDDCIRRVWDYPPDWRTWDAAALAALSWRR
jgi:hypothetical protein